MLKSYKTELAPTTEQEKQIRCTIGVCRYVYNFFLATNNERHKNGEKFMSGMAFSKWLNNEFVPQNPDKAWIKDVSSKAVKKSIMDAETAYKRFFKGMARFPRYKKKSVNDPKMYFVKTDAKAVIRCERHRIKIPTIGWVQLKEYGYLPTDGSIKSGAVSIRAGRYFVSVLAEVPDFEPQELQTDGIGIDLGIKAFATVSNEKAFGNINKTGEVFSSSMKYSKRRRKIQHLSAPRMSSTARRTCKGSA